MARPREDYYERLFSKIDEEPPGLADCWLWKGTIRSKPPNDYGCFSLPGRPCRYIRAHVAVYEALVGPIPEGMELHHTCRNRLCVNPAHLEPVDPHQHVFLSPITVASINSAKTHCPKGHEYDYFHNGKRYCLTCIKESTRKRRQKA